MNELSFIDELDLELINGGNVSKADVVMGVVGCVCPAAGAFWAIKTASDWVYEQNW